MKRCDVRSSDPNRAPPSERSGTPLGAALAALTAAFAPACSATHGHDTTGMITSSRRLDELTRGEFEEMCEEQHGTLEVHPHCGGVNSCKGMSYDTTTHVLTEHTCKGVNTCAGYSCVVGDG